MWALRERLPVSLGCSSFRVELMHLLAGKKTFTDKISVLSDAFVETLRAKEASAKTIAETRRGFERVYMDVMKDVCPLPASVFADTVLQDPRIQHLVQVAKQAEAALLTACTKESNIFECRSTLVKDSVTAFTELEVHVKTVEGMVQEVRREVDEKLEDMLKEARALLNDGAVLLDAGGVSVTSRKEEGTTTDMSA